jgi:hypothetical protein
MTKSSNLMTIGGIVSAFGTSLIGIPLTVTTYYAQVAKTGPPTWFNESMLPMILVGFLMTAAGTAILGVAGKGADEHSTLPQTEAATVKSVADHVVSETEANPSEMPAVPVVIVHPDKEKP